MVAVNVRMALEKFQTDDACCLNGTGKISNRWRQPFEWRMKIFKQVMPALQTANKKFRMGDASHSNS